MMITRRIYTNNVSTLENNMSIGRTPPGQPQQVSTERPIPTADLAQPDSPQYQPVPAPVPPANAFPLQESITHDLNIQGWVPQHPWTVDAIRVIHAVQVRGACSWDFDDTVMSMTFDVIEEVCTHMGWYCARSTNNLTVCDFADFRLA